MRKVLAIALTTLYLVGTAGVVLNKHSCCGQDLGLELIATEHSCCDHGDHSCSSKSEGCCQFDIVFYNVDDEHMGFVPDLFSDAFAIRQMVTPVAICPAIDSPIQDYPDAPDPPKIPQYIKNSSLILYA